MPKQSSDHQRVTLMKGTAILAVIGLHVLSSLPGKIFTQFPMAQWFIAIDQLWRFSVPLFLGLSGYALARKYWPNLELKTFFQRRFLKLLPLYLLWTVGLNLLFLLVPSWNSAAAITPWWQIILLGYGDYHLYFVPLILQFYFLFPLLLLALKKWPNRVLGVSLLLQVGFISYATWFGSSLSWLQTDQAQYSFFLSWISYFVGGMWVAHQKEIGHFSTRKWLGLIGFLWAVLWVALSMSAAHAIKIGLDPLYALKFTRLDVIPYGLLSIFLALNIPWEKTPMPNLFKQTWLKIGELSFLLYLSHTLVLRLIFARHIPGISWGSLVLGMAWLVIGILISRWLETPRTRG